MSNDQRSSPNATQTLNKQATNSDINNSALASLHNLANLTGNCNTNSTNNSQTNNNNNNSSAANPLTNSAMLKFNQDLLGDLMNGMMQMQNNTNLINGDSSIKLENLTNENNSSSNNNQNSNTINPLLNATNGLNLLQQLAASPSATNNALANSALPLATLLAASAGQSQHNQMLLQAIGLGKLSNNSGSNNSNSSNNNNNFNLNQQDLAEQLQQLQQQQFQQNLQQLLLLNQLGQQNNSNQSNNSPLNPLLTNGLQSLLFPNQALLQQGKFFILVHLTLEINLIFIFL